MARRTKRLWTDEAKRSICLQTEAPDVSVALVALRYAVTANLIFKWRRDPRYASGPDPAPGSSEGSRVPPVEIVETVMAHLPRPSPRTLSRLGWRADTGCGSAAGMIPRHWRG